MGGKGGSSRGETEENLTLKNKSQLWENLPVVTPEEDVTETNGLCDIFPRSHETVAKIQGLD